MDDRNETIARLERLLLAAYEELERYRAALDKIDRHVVGAHDTDFGDVEPCDACIEMREIAEQALRPPNRSAP